MGSRQDPNNYETGEQQMLAPTESTELTPSLQLCNLRLGFFPGFWVLFSAFWALQDLFRICFKALLFLRVLVGPLVQIFFGTRLFLWELHWPLVQLLFWDQTFSIGTILVGTVLAFRLIPSGTRLFLLELCCLGIFLFALGKKTLRNGVLVIKMLWGCLYF